MEKEARAIHESIQKSLKRDSISFETRWAARVTDLIQFINEINTLEKKDKIENFVKDPYVLELGRGFSFVSRQKKLMLMGIIFILILFFIIMY